MSERSREVKRKVDVFCKSGKLGWLRHAQALYYAGYLEPSQLFEMLELETELSGLQGEIRQITLREVIEEIPEISLVDFPFPRVSGVSAMYLLYITDKPGSALLVSDFPDENPPKGTQFRAFPYRTIAFSSTGDFIHIGEIKVTGPITWWREQKRRKKQLALFVETCKKHGIRSCHTRAHSTEDGRYWIEKSQIPVCSNETPQGEWKGFIEIAA